MAIACDDDRNPLIVRPAWVSSASVAVGMRKLAAVHALRIDTSTVWAPAKRSRSSTWGKPMRSTTATATWWPFLRHCSNAARAAVNAVSGVSCLTVKVPSWMSSGFSLLLRARFARSLTALVRPIRLR